MKTISVIGPNTSACTPDIYEFGIQLGKFLIDNNFIIVCGGMHGLMEAVCKGAKRSDTYSFGKTVGIIPGTNRNEANIYCDIVIPTGIGFARNVIVVNSGDVVLAVGGGAGTLSEISLAWQFDKKVICFTQYSGWAANLANKTLDNRKKYPLIGVSCFDELKEQLLLLNTKN
ncbi:TIGR00725 family protein [Saccharicrinis sp. FJH2]|uniref:TIGR00725 family protein n=1 Tax=Saccharicrinis sp. FJH65 TaxID=3344659 RepID=UPI0035F46627